MARKMELVKIKRQALAGSIDLYEEPVVIHLPTPMPPVLQPEIYTTAEKERIIGECVSRGYIIGATVIRCHHANSPQAHLPHLVGTITGFDRADPKWNYAPILVAWGNPATRSSHASSFNYHMKDLDLFHYTWENK